ncbi:MAG: porin family protein [Deltaproteobacteria bacterium]|nr:porin family protein [Deltaproteobacteria bacterium]
MRKSALLFLVGLLCASLTSTVWAQRYDRYEKYGRQPPRRGAGAPPPTHAVYGQPYVFGHLGLYEPNDNSDGLEGYDTGGAFDIGIGSRVSPILAVEGTFGAYGADRGSDEVAVVPLTIGVRLVLPAPVIEPYLGAGLGLYFASLDEAGIDDSDTTFGGYGSLGVDAWLNPRMALNFEGRYHWVEPEFEGFDVDVSGWMLSLGIRVSF